MQTRLLYKYEQESNVKHSLIKQNNIIPIDLRQK